MAEVLGDLPWDRAGTVLSTAKGDPKSLGHAWGALGACNIQGCSPPSSRRLGDSSVVLACSACSMGPPSTHQTASGAVVQSQCSISQLFPSAGVAFLRV